MNGSDQPTIYDAPAPPPPPAPRSGRGTWIALSIAAAVLLIGGGALLAVVLAGSGSGAEVTASRNETETETQAEAEAEKSKLGGPSAEDGGSAASESTTVSSDTPPTAPAPTLPTVPSSAAPATAPPPTQRPAVPATVSRTCGANGTGDCFLALRSGPSTVGPELGRLNEGDVISLDCQQRGESIKPSALGYSTDVWARSTDGRWLSMAFLDAPGWPLTDITVPC